MITAGLLAVLMARRAAPARGGDRGGSAARRLPRAVPSLVRARRLQPVAHARGGVPAGALRARRSPRPAPATPSCSRGATRRSTVSSPTDGTTRCGNDRSTASRMDRDHGGRAGGRAVAPAAPDHHRRRRAQDRHRRAEQGRDRLGQGPRGDHAGWAPGRRGVLDRGYAVRDLVLVPVRPAGLGSGGEPIPSDQPILRDPMGSVAAGRRLRAAGTGRRAGGRGSRRRRPDLSPSDRGSRRVRAQPHAGRGAGRIRDAGGAGRRPGPRQRCPTSSR